MRRKMLPAAALPDRPAALGLGIASIMRSSIGNSQNLVSRGRRSAATALVVGRNVESRNTHGRVFAEDGEPAEKSLLTSRHVGLAGATTLLEIMSE
jgi:hypothetical protein